MSWSEQWGCYLPYRASVPTEACPIRHTEKVDGVWRLGADNLGVVVSTNGVKHYRLVCHLCRRSVTVGRKVVFEQFGLTENDLWWKRINSRTGDVFNTEEWEVDREGVWQEVTWTPPPLPPPPQPLPAPPGSVVEEEFLKFCLDTDLSVFTKMVAQHEIKGFRVDFAFPEYLLAIEIDGFAYHSDQHSFIADRRRQRVLQREGWQVYRFAALEVMHAPRKCANEIIRMIYRLQRTADVFEDWS